MLSFILFLCVSLVFAQSSTDCDVCTTIFYVIEAFLGEDAAPAETLAALDYVCDKIFENGTSLHTRCDDIALSLSESLTPLYAQLVFANYTPQALCSIGSMCFTDCCEDAIDPEQIRLYPGLTDDVMQVVWSTALAEGNMQSEVYYGVAGSPLSLVAAGEPFEHHGLGFRGLIHNATLVALVPGTSYSYQIRMVLTGATSPVFTFRTRQSGPAVSMLFIGDMGVNYESNATIARLVQHRTEHDLLFHNGDISYDDMVVARQAAFVRKVQPYAAELPALYSPGNHDALGWFLTYQGYYNRYMPGADQNEFYYARRLGALMLLVISAEDPFDTAFISESTVEWLEQQLQGIDRTETPWVVVSFHRTMYCHGNNSDCLFYASYIRSRVEKVMLVGGVDLYVNAHKHYGASLWPMYDGQICALNYTVPRACPVPMIQGAAGQREGLEQPEVGSFVRVGWEVYSYSTLQANNTHLSFAFYSSETDELLDLLVLEK